MIPYCKKVPTPNELNVLLMKFIRLMCNQHCLLLFESWEVKSVTVAQLHNARCPSCIRIKHVPSLRRRITVIWPMQLANNVIWKSHSLQSMNKSITMHCNAQCKITRIQNSDILWPKDCDYIALYNLWRHETTRNISCSGFVYCMYKMRFSSKSLLWLAVSNNLSTLFY